MFEILRDPPEQIIPIPWCLLVIAGCFSMRSGLDTAWQDSE